MQWHMPSQRFAVNAASLKLAILNYNIASAIKGLCFSPEERTARFKKYRLLLVHVAGRMNRNHCVMRLRLCASEQDHRAHQSGMEGVLVAHPSLTHEALAACGLTDSARPPFSSTRRELTFGWGHSWGSEWALLRGEPPACSVALARGRRPPAGFRKDVGLRAGLDAKSNRGYFGRQLRYGPVRRVSSMVTAQPAFAGLLGLPDSQRWQRMQRAPRVVPAPSPGG